MEHIKILSFDVVDIPGCDFQVETYGSATIEECLKPFCEENQIETENFEILPSSPERPAYGMTTLAAAVREQDVLRLKFTEASRRSKVTQTQSRNSGTNRIYNIFYTIVQIGNNNKQFVRKRGRQYPSNSTDDYESGDESDESVFSHDESFINIKTPSSPKGPRPTPPSPRRKTSESSYASTIESVSIFTDAVPDVPDTPPTPRDPWGPIGASSSRPFSMPVTPRTLAATPHFGKTSTLPSAFPATLPSTFPATLPSSFPSSPPPKPPLSTQKSRSSNLMARPSVTSIQSQQFDMSDVSDGEDQPVEYENFNSLENRSKRIPRAILDAAEHTTGFWILPTEHHIHAAHRKLIEKFGDKDGRYIVFQFGWTRLVASVTYEGNLRHFQIAWHNNQLEVSGCGLSAPDLRSLMQKLERTPLDLKSGSGEVTLRRPIKRIPVPDDEYEIPVSSPYVDMTGREVNGATFHV